MNKRRCFHLLLSLPLFLLGLAWMPGAGWGVVEARPLPDSREAQLRNDGWLEFMGPDGSVIAGIDVEIASTPEEHVRGLMGRRLPDFTHGMLFVFEQARIRHLWMRKTPSSLDMIFVGEDGRVLNVARRTVPMSHRLYRSAGPAKFVVEVKAGFAERFGITAGTRIRWSRKPLLSSGPPD